MAYTRQKEICTNCGKKVTSSLLNQHLKSCLDEVLKTRLKKQHVKREKKVFHSNSDVRLKSSGTSAKSPPYMCKFKGCNITFNTQSTKSSHMSRVHSQPVNCPFDNCESVLKKSSLYNHIKNVHEKAKKLCINCGEKVLYTCFHPHLKKCTVKSTALGRSRLLTKSSSRLLSRSSSRLATQSSSRLSTQTICRSSKLSTRSLTRLSKLKKKGFKKALKTATKITNSISNVHRLEKTLPKCIVMLERICPKTLQMLQKSADMKKVPKKKTRHRSKIADSIINSFNSLNLNEVQVNDEYRDNEINSEGVNRGVNTQQSLRSDVSGINAVSIPRALADLTCAQETHQFSTMLNQSESLEQAQSSILETISNSTCHEPLMPESTSQESSHISVGYSLPNILDDNHDMDGVTILEEYSTQSFQNSFIEEVSSTYPSLTEKIQEHGNDKSNNDEEHQSSDDSFIDVLTCDNNPMNSSCIPAGEVIVEIPPENHNTLGFPDSETLEESSAFQLSNDGYNKHEMDKLQIVYQALDS